MRVCYHVETHTRPAQAERLVRLLHEASPECRVVVSHDERAAPLPAALGALDRVVVRRDPGGYGDLAHVERWLTTARWLGGQPEPYGWLVNLSGQCYPLRPVKEIESDLDEAADRGTDGFLHSVRVGSPESNWSERTTRDRYYFRHRRLGPSHPRRGRVARLVAGASHVQPWFRVSTTTGPTVAVRRPLPEPLRDGGLRGGSFFAALGPRAVSRVVAAVDGQPALMHWFRTVVSPAEVFLQTMLAPATDLRLDPDNRRFADFTQRLGNHPAVIDRPLLDRALDSGADFARKFDERVHPGLLDQVDVVAHGGLGR